jgi:hypothetical protein
LDVSLDQESPLFLEGSYQVEDNENENLDNSNVSKDKDPQLGHSTAVQMLRIRGICEGNPDARLTRLLARKKFDEAEKYFFKVFFKWSIFKNKI